MRVLSATEQLDSNEPPHPTFLEDISPFLEILLGGLRDFGVLQFGDFFFPPKTFGKFSSV